MYRVYTRTHTHKRKKKKITKIHKPLESGALHTIYIGLSRVFSKYNFFFFLPIHGSKENTKKKPQQNDDL